MTPIFSPADRPLPVVCSGQWGDQTDFVQHVGLGEACEAEVTVRWPDAALTTETFTLGGGYRWRIAQGQEPTVLR